MKRFLNQRGLAAALCVSLLLCAVLAVRNWGLTQQMKASEEKNEQIEGMLRYELRFRLVLQDDVFWFVTHCLSQEPAKIEYLQGFLEGVTQVSVQEPALQSYQYVFQEDKQWLEMFERLDLLNLALSRQIGELSQEELKQVEEACQALQKGSGGFRSLVDCLDAPPDDQGRIEAFAQANTQLGELERILALEALVGERP